MKDTYIKIRVRQDLKTRAQKILKERDESMSGYITKLLEKLIK